MSLTQIQFDILSQLEKAARNCVKAQLTANDMKDCESLKAQGFIKEGVITQKGIDALEPYRVKRAVFFAAGFGSRLTPITHTTPKPLVKVNGVRMIETLLSAVKAADIESIYIVRGHLAQAFDVLKEQYAQIVFIENPLYSQANNISSALVAKDLLAGAYVLEADLVLSNPNLITKYQYCSNYLGVPVKETSDWCFYTQDNRIVKMAIGGKNCHHMYGISYWSERDGERLAKDIERVYQMQEGCKKYWDQVALDYFIKDYDVAVRPCTFNDIVEIDTLEDLKKIDKAYQDMY